MRREGNLPSTYDTNLLALPGDLLPEEYAPYVCHPPGVRYDRERQSSCRVNYPVFPGGDFPFRPPHELKQQLLIDARADLLSKLNILDFTTM